MLDMIKNAFIDKETGGLKLGSILAVAAGAVCGVFLAPMIPGLAGLVGTTAAPIIAGVVGGGAALLAKETFMPSGRSEPDPAAHIPAGHHGAGRVAAHHGGGHAMVMDEPHHGGVPGGHGAAHSRG